MSYFGTDGIRGYANEGNLTADSVLRIAVTAAGLIREELSQEKEFFASGVTPKVLIGKDTRASGYMLESAIMAGFLAAGWEVHLLGPIPTPAVAMLTQAMRADVGVMISASHNPYYDNGIKFFDSRGMKFSDLLQQKIETALETNRPLTDFYALGGYVGRARRLVDAQGRYVEFLKSTLPRRSSFSGLKVVLDCAHGAAYKVAPTLLFELGAEVESIGVVPNGRNINDRRGALDLDALCKRVRSTNADFGIALDGDGDRIMLCDELGRVVDGDLILAVLAKVFQDQNKLSEDCIVSTTMSNLGLEVYLKSLNINMIRTSVGDRHVLAELEQKNLNLGGEQSGHVILKDFSTTGDGLLAAIHICHAYLGQKALASEFLFPYSSVPQQLHAVDIPRGVDPLNDSRVKETIEREKMQLLNQEPNSRILVRKSGTEPKVRVMIESTQEHLMEQPLQRIVESIQSTLSKYK